MPIVVDAAEAAKGRQAVEVKGVTRKARDADSYYATLYMGAAPDNAAASMGRPGGDKSLPQAYLVEQPANATVPPHFHDTDQFQVFVAGAASFGKQMVRPLSLHYAGGHTPYGPIVTTDESAHYFTLRANWDSGAKPMPQSRDRLKPVRRCHRLAEDIAAADMPAGRADVLPAEADGLGAALFRLAPGQTEALDLNVAGGGQYALVTAGSVTHDGADLAEHSCLYRFAEEAPLTLTAGPAGAAVLLMQFPAHADG